MLNQTIYLYHSCIFNDDSSVSVAAGSDTTRQKGEKTVQDRDVDTGQKLHHGTDQCNL